MSLETAIAAIQARAKSLWPGIEAAVPISWPNETFQRQVDGSGNPLPWVRIEARWVGGDFQSIGAPGNNWTRREGLIWIYAFIPQGSGEARAHQLVAEAAAMFEGTDFGGVVCLAMSPGGDADSEDGLYFGQSASIPFQFDETA